MYMNDSDDGFMLMSQDDSFNPCPHTSNGQTVSDTMPMQLAYPYFKNEGVTYDPMDPAQESERLTAGGDNINPSLSACPATQRTFNLMEVADYGVNFQYFDPTYISTSGNLQQTGIQQSQIQRPANTYMALSSMWGRRSTGAPYGGGNMGVDAPCIFDASGNDTRPGASGGYAGYYWFGGWNPDQTLAWNEFGGVWPWHTDGKVVIVSFGDGHTKAQQLTSLAAGCNVLDGFAGEITDKSKYGWATTF